MVKNSNAQGPKKRKFLILESLSKRSFSEIVKKLLVSLFNIWFWRKFFNKLMSFLFSSEVVKISSKAPDAKVLSMEENSPDSKEFKYKSLVKDYIDQTPKDMPLILNIGSYN